MGLKGSCILAVASSACLVGGGGPTVGYGTKHGWFAGAQVGGGVEAPLQAWVGVERSQDGTRGYAHLDLGGENFNEDDDREAIGGGWVGGGLVRAEDGAIHGIFAVRADVGRLLDPQQPPPDFPNESCGTGTNYALLGAIEVRYMTEWQIVVAPRIEAHDRSCWTRSLE